MSTGAGGSVRAALAASWAATLALLEARARDGLPADKFTQNAASTAGQYLDAARGDTDRARRMLPTTEGAFWSLVDQHIRAVATEDRDRLDLAARRGA